MCARSVEGAHDLAQANVSSSAAMVVSAVDTPDAVCRVVVRTT